MKEGEKHGKRAWVDECSREGGEGRGGAREGGVKKGGITVCYYSIRKGS